MSFAKWIPTKHAVPRKTGQYPVLALAPEQEGRRLLLQGSCHWAGNHWCQGASSLPPGSSVLAWFPRVKLTDPSVDVSLGEDGHLEVTFPMPAFTVNDLNQLSE